MYRILVFENGKWSAEKTFYDADKIESIKEAYRLSGKEFMLVAVMFYSSGEKETEVI